MNGSNMFCSRNSVSNNVDDIDNDDGGDDDIYIMMKCLSVTFLLIPAPSPSPGFHTSRWVFMVLGGFFMVQGRFIMIPV